MIAHVPARISGDLFGGSPAVGNDSVVDPTRGTKSEVPQGVTGKPPARRGTTNGNARGDSEDRRRRREWLVQTYRADVDVFVVDLFHGPVIVPVTRDSEGSTPACRCYRCGTLMTVNTLTVDRIRPGCQGGTYARSNIRPACSRCNSSTGAVVRGKTAGRGTSTRVPQVIDEGVR